jgi:hypothetical protein
LAPVREHPPNEWGFSNPTFNTQKRRQVRAIAIEPVRHRYGSAKALSIAAGGCDLKLLQRLLRALIQRPQIDKRHRQH